MPTTDRLPDYDPTLKAYHAAFEPELTAAIRQYELGPAARVLDCPCGDGFYARILAGHMLGGTLIAADLSDAYLDAARSTVGPAPVGLTLKFVRADAYALPFDDASFDLVWCAQSMISLDDPLRALCEMARVLRPGGRVAVLETDEYHHVLVPWPIGLELAVQNAVRAACRKRYGSGTKFAQARKLRGLFQQAGLSPEPKRTVVADRAAPFGPAERDFLRGHFEYMRGFVHRELKIGELDELARFTSADNPDSFLNAADAELTCLATVCHATKV